MSDIIEDECLICPITMELFNDPITLNCCGNTISREPLRQHMNSNLSCPLCRADLSDFDVENAPKTVNIAHMVEKHLKSISNQEIIIEEKPKFVATLHPIKDQSYKTVVAKLNIASTENIFKSLIIPIIDISGSMSGSPIEQAKYSLSRIVDLSYQNQNNITNIVTYNDNFKIIEINTQSPESHYNNIVKNLQSGGGTSFASAFKGICQVITKFKNDNNITNVVIVFMTDGQDGWASGEGRNKLIEQFRNDINSITDKPTTVHTIGFGANHDFDFLDNLRHACIEGCYKYADPKEDLDSLSNKVNSIIDVIMNSTYVPLKIVDELDIIHDYKDNSYFINITKNIINSIRIEVNGEIFSVPVQLKQENEPSVKKDWYGYLIDQVGQEIIILSQVDINVLDNKVHIELLEKRCKAIMVRVNSLESDYHSRRLNKLLDMIHDIKKNIKIDKLKLTDMASEGKFVSNNSSHVPIVQVSTPYVNQVVKNIPSVKNNKLEYIDKNEMARNLVGEWTEISQLNNKDIIVLINKKLDQIDDFLILCSIIGRFELVEYLLNLENININYKNSFGYNASDYAIIRGFWISSGILLSKMAPTINPNLLFTSCIHYGYFNTAEVLMSKKIVSCTPKFLNYILTQKQLHFINNNSVGEIDIETMIQKGLFSKIKNHTDKVSWKVFMNIITKLTETHYEIIEYLIENQQLDPNEMIINEGISTWPLFIACEKGIVPLYQLLVNHTMDIHKQNEKGTTILWIASCNKHIDIVEDLLNRNADPNICNIKGDSPLIAAIQKGSKTIIELLLAYGAKMNLNNINRDNCILIACRNGQDEVLDLLLSKTSSDEEKQMYLTTYAEIDGFCPLLAATELDRVGCIKVLHRHGVDMGIKSQNDNKIIKGANAIHLACHYGRINALKCLVELGCDLSVQTDVDKFTALHIAIKQSHNIITRYLLGLPEGQKLLKVHDIFGKLPSYYARSAGNEEILEDFFNDTLSNCLSDVINTTKTNQEITKKCIDKLVNHSQSLTCFEYDDVLDTNVGIDKFSTYSLLTRNEELIGAIDNMVDHVKLIGNGESSDYEFWKCLTSRQDSKNPQVEEELEKIKKVESNIQSKILLDTKSFNKLIMSGSSDIDQNIKMNDGFSLLVQDGVLEKLQNANKLSSLLGFFEKVKDKKTLDYLLTEAKMNAIKKIRQGCILSPLCLIVLYLYTGHLEIYNQVNSTLMDWSIKNIYKPFTESLYQAIKMLDVYDGEVYRAVNVPYNSNQYEIGNIVVWNTFSIGSYQWNSANSQVASKSGMIFIIKNKTGRILSPYSKYEADCEVSYLPGCTFKVTNHYKSSIFCLGQANIRNSTYKMDENYYAKVNSCQEAIIIELEEQ